MSWSQAMPPHSTNNLRCDCGPGEAWLVSVMLSCQGWCGACRLGIYAHIKEIDWSVPAGSPDALPQGHSPLGLLKASRAGGGAETLLCSQASLMTF